MGPSSREVLGTTVGNPGISSGRHEILEGVDRRQGQADSAGAVAVAGGGDDPPCCVLYCYVCCRLR